MWVTWGGQGTESADRVGSQLGELADISPGILVKRVAGTSVSYVQFPGPRNACCNGLGLCVNYPGVSSH